MWLQIYINKKKQNLLKPQIFLIDKASEKKRNIRDFNKFCVFLFIYIYIFFLWSNGLVVKMMDSRSRGSVFKTTGWLQGRLSLSSFRGR